MRFLTGCCVESVSCTWSLANTPMSLRSGALCASYAFCQRVWFPSSCLESFAACVVSLSFQHSVPRVVCTAWRFLQTTCGNVSCPSQRFHAGLNVPVQMLCTFHPPATVALSSNELWQHPCSQQLTRYSAWCVRGHVAQSSGRGSSGLM